MFHVQAGTAHYCCVAQRLHTSCTLPKALSGASGKDVNTRVCACWSLLLLLTPPYFPFSTLLKALLKRKADRHGELLGVLWNAEEWRALAFHASEATAVSYCRVNPGVCTCCISSERCGGGFSAIPCLYMPEPLGHALSDH